MADELEIEQALVFKGGNERREAYAFFFTYHCSWNRCRAHYAH